MPVIFTVFFPTHFLFKMTSCYISMLLFIYIYIPYVVFLLYATKNGIVVIIL